MLELVQEKFLPYVMRAACTGPEVAIIFDRHFCKITAPIILVESENLESTGTEYATDSQNV